jgi:hypothetical protein
VFGNKLRIIEEMGLALFTVNSAKVSNEETKATQNAVTDGD